MAFGLRTWDSAGNPLIDVSTRLTRLLYAATISANGSYSNAAFSQGTFWWCVIGTTYYQRPNVSIAGTTVTWTFPGATSSCKILLGVY